MKLFVDDVRNPPDVTWTVVRSVNSAIRYIRAGVVITDMSLDHDAGDYAHDGGDFIKILDYLAEYGGWPVNRPTIHSMNPVGRENMHMVIDRYGPY